MNGVSVKDIISQADLLLDHGRITEARELYLQASKVDPGNADAHFMLGVIAYDAGDIITAENQFKRCLDLDNVYADAHLHYADILRKKNNIEDAVHHAREAVENDDAYAEAWLILGELLASQGNYPDALNAINKSIEINQQLPTALRKAAHIEMELGNNQRARDLCHQSLLLNPDDIEVNNVLGSIYLRDNRHIDAIKCFDNVLNIQALDIDANRGKAYANMASGNIQVAVECYTKVLSVNPVCEASLIYLARAYSQTKEIDKAVDCVRRVIDINKENVEAHTIFGEMSMLMGCYGEALTHYDEALAKSPYNVEAIIGRSRLYIKTGERDKAYKDIEPLLKAQDIPVQALILHAQLARDSSDRKVSIEKLENSIDRVSGVACLPVYQELGRLYEKETKYEKSFYYYSQANKLRKYSYKPEVIEKLVNWIISEYSAENIKSAQTSSIHSEQPVFVVGMLRSGTSLMEQILASHPDVRGCGELQYIPQLSASVENDNKLNLLKPPSLASLGEEKLTKIANIYLDKVNELINNSPRFTDKMLYNVFHLGFIALLYPNCRVIHCTRDSLDICLSNYFQDYSGYDGFATNLESIGHFYKQFERLMNHWKMSSVLPVTEIKYEKLVSNPQEEISRILEFCGLEWNAACLKFYDNPRLVNTASYDQIRKPLYKTSVARWKNYEGFIEPLRKVLGHDSC